MKRGDRQANLSLTECWPLECGYPYFIKQVFQFKHVKLLQNHILLIFIFKFFSRSVGLYQLLRFGVKHVSYENIDMTKMRIVKFSVRPVGRRQIIINTVTNSNSQCLKSRRFRPDINSGMKFFDDCNSIIKNPANSKSINLSTRTLNPLSPHSR